MSTPARHHRFHLLDAFRGLAALLIASHHAPPYLLRHLPQTQNFLAVDFFFCLSGFVIAFAYEQKLVSGLGVTDFTVARLIRLYPSYLLATVLSLLLAMGTAHALASPAGRASLLGSLDGLLFLPTVPMGPQYHLYLLDVPAWSLLFELLVNVLYALASRYRLTSSWVLATVSLVALGFIVFSAQSLDNGSTWPGLGMGCARVLFSFPVGVLLFRWWQHRGRAAAVPPAVGWLLSALLLAALTVDPHLRHERGYDLLLILLFFPMLTFVGSQITLPAQLTVAAIALGDLSYPLYVLHTPLLALLKSRSVERVVLHHSELSWTLVPVSVLLIAALALWLARHFDAPVRKRLTALYARHS